MVEHITYITYSEIFGVLPSEYELSKEICILKKVTNFALVASFNTLLSLFPGDHNSQELAIQNLIDQDTLDLIKQKFKNEDTTKRPIFHRQQLLTLMKRILLESPYDGLSDPNSENSDINISSAKRLGNICLMLNNFLVSSEQEGRLKRKDHTEQAKKEVLDELLVQWLPMVELMNPPKIVNAIARSNKYFEIFRQEFSEVMLSSGKNIMDYFFATNHISLDNYLKLIYGIYIYYTTQELEDYKRNSAMLNFYQNKIFANLQIPENELNNFFKLTAKSLDGIVEELRQTPTSLPPQYDFTIFRKYPLVILKEDLLTCIDVTFLLEKLAFGIYHTIFNSFDPLAEKKDRDLFASHWGKVFEKYIDFLLSQVYPPLSMRLISFANFENTRSQQEAFDGVINSGNKLIVMEYKGGFLNSTAKYSGKISSLLEDLDKKYGSKKKAGIEQLSRKIGMVFSPNIELRETFKGFSSSDINNVKVIYPVLIVQEHSLQMGLAIKKLREIFNEEIKKQNILSSLFVRPLSVLSIEDLELLVPYIEKFSFTDILEEYTTVEHNELASFQEILKIFCSKNNYSNQPNEWIYDQNEKLLNSIRNLMIEEPNKTDDQNR